MFNKANVVGILIKAKKHGLVFFDGEIVFAVSHIGHDGGDSLYDIWNILLATSFNNISQSVRSEDDDEFVVLQKPIGDIRRAFGEMRDRSKSYNPVMI